MLNPHEKCSPVIGQISGRHWLRTALVSDILQRVVLLPQAQLSASLPLANILVLLVAAFDVLLVPFPFTSSASTVSGPVRNLKALSASYPHRNL